MPNPLWTPVPALGKFICWPTLRLQRAGALPGKAVPCARKRLLLRCAGSAIAFAAVKLLRYAPRAGAGRRGGRRHGSGQEAGGEGAGHGRGPEAHDHRAGGCSTLFSLIQLCCMTSEQAGGATRCSPTLVLQPLSTCGRGHKQQAHAGRRLQRSSAICRTNSPYTHVCAHVLMLYDTYACAHPERRPSSACWSMVWRRKSSPPWAAGSASTRCALSSYRLAVDSC